MKLKEILKRMRLRKIMNIIKYGRVDDKYDTVELGGFVFKFDMGIFKENH